jgi:hypothetical protein
MFECKTYSGRRDCIGSIRPARTAGRQTAAAATRTRWLLHYELMIKGMHNATKVQAAFKKYDINDFFFRVLEYTNPDHVSMMEAQNR